MRRAARSRKWTIPIEWITFTIAAAIVAALVGAILLIWMVQTNEPPQMAITTEAVQRKQNQFYVPFTVENIGGGTAESVQVIGELKQGDQVLEGGEQQIDFLSGGEQEEGAFIFSQDPRRYSLTVRVASYKLP